MSRKRTTHVIHESLGTVYTIDGVHARHQSLRVHFWDSFDPDNARMKAQRHTSKFVQNTIPGDT